MILICLFSVASFAGFVKESVFVSYLLKNLEPIQQKSGESSISSQTFGGVNVPPYIP